MIPNKYYQQIQDLYSSKNGHWKTSIEEWRKTMLNYQTYQEWVFKFMQYFQMDPKVAGLYECCCADGTLLEIFRRLAGFKVKGFDVSEEFINLAHGYGRDWVNLIDAADVEAEPEPWYVYAFDAFEHLPVSTLRKLLGVINQFALILVAHNYTDEFRTNFVNNEESIRVIEGYEFYKDAPESIPSHLINMPRAWWVEFINENLTNMIRMEIPDNWDIFGKPHMGLFVYRRIDESR